MLFSFIVTITGWIAHELLQRTLHLTLLSFPQNYIPHNPLSGLLIIDCIHLCLVIASVSPYLTPVFFTHLLFSLGCCHTPSLSLFFLAPVSYLDFALFPGFVLRL